MIKRIFDLGETKELVYLQLAGQPSDICFDARHYTKIGEHEADVEDAETMRLYSSAPVELAP